MYISSKISVPDFVEVRADDPGHMPHTMGPVMCDTQEPGIHDREHVEAYLFLLQVVKDIDKSRFGGRYVHGYTSSGSRSFVRCATSPCL